MQSDTIHDKKPAKKIVNKTKSRKKAKPKQFQAEANNGNFVMLKNGNIGLRQIQYDPPHHHLPVPGTSSHWGTAHSMQRSLPYSQLQYNSAPAADDSPETNLPTGAMRLPLLPVAPTPDICATYDSSVPRPTHDLSVPRPTYDVSVPHPVACDAASSTEHLVVPGFLTVGSHSIGVMKNLPDLNSQAWKWCPVVYNDSRNSPKIGITKAIPLYEN